MASTPEELLELPTSKFESWSDEELIVIFGPAIANCQPLPGSDEEEKARKLAEKEAKEAAELEAEASMGGDSKLPNDGNAGQQFQFPKPKPRATKKTRGAKAQEQMAELLKMMMAQGVKAEDVKSALPSELQVKK